MHPLSLSSVPTLHLLQTTPELNPSFFCIISFPHLLDHCHWHTHTPSITYLTKRKKSTITQFLFSLVTQELFERAVSSLSISTFFSSHHNQVFIHWNDFIEVTKSLRLTMSNYPSSSYYTSQHLRVDHSLSWDRFFFFMVSTEPHSLTWEHKQ